MATTVKHNITYTGFVTRLTWRVPLVEQELLTIEEHLSSPPVFSGVRVTQSLVLCVHFVDRCLSFFFWSLCCLFFFRFWLPYVSSNSSYNSTTLIDSITRGCIEHTFTWVGVNLIKHVLIEINFIGRWKSNHYYFLIFKFDNLYILSLIGILFIVGCLFQILVLVVMSVQGMPK